MVLIAGLLLAGMGGACDWTQGLGDPEPPPAPPHKPSVDAAAPGDGPAGYDGMCRHYCQTLQETDILACVSCGGELDGCRAAEPTADTCFEARCTGQRVDVPLCLMQCDAVARYYDQRCPVVGPSTDPLCPASQADHDSACRAGCAL